MGALDELYVGAIFLCDVRHHLLHLFSLGEQLEVSHVLIFVYELEDSWHHHNGGFALIPTAFFVNLCDDLLNSTLTYGSDI